VALDSSRDLRSVSAAPDFFAGCLYPDCRNEESQHSSNCSFERKF